MQERLVVVQTRRDVLLHRERLVTREGTRFVVAPDRRQTVEDETDIVIVVPVHIPLPVAVTTFEIYVVVRARGFVCRHGIGVIADAHVGVAGHVREMGFGGIVVERG